MSYTLWAFGNGLFYLSPIIHIIYEDTERSKNIMIVLKAERLFRGWSQFELAKRADLNPNTICQIELRRYRPYQAQLKKIARAFGFSESQAEALLEPASNPAGNWGRRDSSRVAGADQNQSARTGNGGNSQ